MNISPVEFATADYDQNFIKYWDKVFTEYREKQEYDCLWLAGPSSYVFSIGDERFAVDLQIRRKKDLDALLPRLVSDLSDLSFVLITHQHDDHMCPPLMRALKDTDIKWYIPRGTNPELIEKSEIKKENTVLVDPGDVFTVGNVTVRAFLVPHGRAEFVEVGYELTTPNGKILMPADIRDYDYDEYPDFENIDLCLSHLWAGNDAIDPENYMPLLEKFAKRSASFNAKRYFLCHLYEIGRKEKFMWHNDHAAIAIEMLKVLLPDSLFEIPRLGERYELFLGE